MNTTIVLNKAKEEDSHHVLSHLHTSYENSNSVTRKKNNTTATFMSMPLEVASLSMSKILATELLANTTLSVNCVSTNHNETLTGTPSIKSASIIRFTSHGMSKTSKPEGFTDMGNQVRGELDNEIDLDDFTLAFGDTAHIMMHQSLTTACVEMEADIDGCFTSSMEPLGEVISFVSFRRPSSKRCHICRSNLPSLANFCPQCGSSVETQAERMGFVNAEAESSLSSKLVSPSLDRDGCVSFNATSLTPSRDCDSYSERSPHRRQVYRHQVLVVNHREAGKLGGGSNGTVYKAFDIASGQQFAVKQMYINPQNQSEIDAIRNELRHLSHLRHPKVIEYYGCSIQYIKSKTGMSRSTHPMDTMMTPENSNETIQVYILMERMECGTLQELLKNLPDGFPESTVRAYTAQLLEAIHYLHQRGVSHCDIKPSNLLLASDGTIKLADFGCAKMRAAYHSDAEPLERQLGGTPVYMPPETLLNLSIEITDWVFLGQAQDIWALGCVVHQLLTGKTPWAFTEISNPFALLSYIKAHPQFPIADELSVCARNFCQLCLEPDPQIRVKNMEKILVSSFISSPVEYPLL